MSRRDGIPWDTEARRMAGNQWVADQPAFTHRVGALTHARCCFSSVLSVPLWFNCGFKDKTSGSGNAPNGAKRPPAKPHHAYRTVSLMQQANFHLYKTCIDNIYLDLDS